MDLEKLLIPQEVIDKCSFYGKIIDDISEQIDLLEKELKTEVQEARIKVTKRIINALKTTLRHYKVTQKVYAHEAGI